MTQKSSHIKTLADDMQDEIDRLNAENRNLKNEIENLRDHAGRLTLELKYYRENGGVVGLPAIAIDGKSPIFALEKRGQ